jgi:general secretion pathway protein J
MSRPARGFTLLEMIVVIGIFAIFAAMAYGGLNTVLTARSRIDESLARSAEYHRAYLRMRGDFQNAAGRSVRSGDGEPLPAFLFESYNKRIEFTRAGWLNLLGLPRSSFERVSYLLDDKPEEGSTAKPSLDDRRLVRRSWLLLDRAPQTQPVDLTLLPHVADMGIRFLGASNNWSDGWPADDQAGAQRDQTNLPPPSAIEIKLRTKDWGDLRFVFQVGAESAAKLADASRLAPAAATPAATTGGTTSGGTTTTSGTSAPAPAPAPSQ